MDEICQIFFEDTNPGSKLREIRRLVLAVELNEAYEGAAHDYNIPTHNKVLGGIITIDDSEEVRAPEHAEEVIAEHSEEVEASTVRRSQRLETTFHLQDRDDDHGF